MPLYVFKCPACGYKADVLQKYNDPAPTCRACEAAIWSGEPRQSTMERQLTTAGFEIKGLLR